MIQRDDTLTRFFMSKGNFRYVLKTNLARIGIDRELRLRMRSAVFMKPGGVAGKKSGERDGRRG
jgi:hypothetical protein